MIGPLLEAPVPRRARVGHVLGSLLLASILLQAVTGILLSLYYSPTPERAYPSVRYIENQMGGAGRMVRGLHHFGAGATVVLAGAHLLAVFVRGAYKGDRRWTWISGVVLLLVVLGFGFTGYLLPNDQKAHAALNVGAGIAGSIPLVGPTLQAMLWGGPVPEPWTLQRLFTFHAVALPAALVLLFVVHAVQVARRGLGGEGKFHPDLLPKIAAAVLLLVLGLSAAAWIQGAPLECEADATNVTYNAHPEWYFFGLQKLLDLSSWGMVVPAVIVALLAAAPWIDRSPEGGRRTVAGALAGLLVVGWGGMTLWGYASWRAAEASKPPPPPIPAEDFSWVTNEERVARGTNLWGELNCVYCHHKRYSPFVGTGINVPSELASAGDRLKPTWTVRYLMDPWPIRWQEKDKRPLMRMPHYRLAREEAKDLTAYLATLHDPARVPATGIDWAKARPEALSTGRQLYVKFECANCHKIGAEGSTGGPDLTGTAEKLTPDYLYAITRHAKKVLRDTPMNDYSDKAPEEIEAVVRYLLSLGTAGGR